MSSTRVYPAERAVFGRDRMWSRDGGVSLADATAIVHRYVPGLDVSRSQGRASGGSRYHYGTPTRPPRITLCRYAGLPVVLHETAHALTPGHAHGRAFREEYVRLVSIEMSPWWARRLAASFRRHGYRDSYVTDVGENVA